jgi:hypothetical protein
MTPQPKEADEMKACPFCSATDAFSERADLSSSYVVCNNCLARGPVECQESDDEEEPGRSGAITAWNTRTPPSASIEVTEALKPFAVIARHCAGEPDETVLYVHQGVMGDYPLTIGDFRKANDALERARQKDQS